MSDDPNDRAARLAGRWGDEDDAAGEDDGVAGASVSDPGGSESPGASESPESPDSEGADSEAEAGGETDSETEGEAEANDGADSAPGDDTGDGTGNETGEESDDDSEGAMAGRVGGDAEADRELTTREMQSQMLYLPPAFHKEVDLTFEELNLRFRRERDRKLEKNRDFYLGLLRLGLEELGDVDDRELDEVEELLDL